MLALNVGFAKAVEELAGETWTPVRAQEKARKDAAKDDPDHERRQHEVARWLWDRREPLAGSIAERYLRETRAYGGPLPPTLGFLRAYKDHRPALIAAFAIPGEIEPGVLAKPSDVQSVQLIALKPDGSSKADVEHPKKIVGSPSGLPIAVSPFDDNQALAICEGLEDALSVYEATTLPCWASGGAGFLPKLAVVVPSHIKRVTIFAHSDKAGRAGAYALAESLYAEGVAVFIDGAD